MDIKYTKTVVIIILLTTVYATCRKNCTPVNYSFNVYAQAYPDKDSIHVGDTLWLEVNCPTTLLDNISGKMIDYSAAQNLGVAVSLLSIHGGSVSDPGTSYVLDSFMYVFISGAQHTSGQFANNYLFSELNGSYQFRLGVIPERAGTFALTITDAGNVYTNSNKCSKATFYITYNQTKQHLYLYQNSRPGYQISSYESTHSYYFKVY